jgi:hypothetical protein
MFASWSSAASATRGEEPVGAGSLLSRRHLTLVELDRLDCERSGPAGLVVERVLERCLGILFAAELRHGHRRAGVEKASASSWLG